MNKFYFSFISPTRYIEDLSSKGDFILALSHLLDLDRPNSYEITIKRTGLPIYLDNGLFENKIPERMDSLISKAINIKAELIFCPDHLYNRKKTEMEIDFTEKELIDRGLFRQIKLAAVVQAKTKKEYLEFYKDLCKNNTISLIGLSILTIPYVYKKPIAEARIALMKDLLKLKIKHKDCHLLGIGDSYKDVRFAIKNCPWIKSNDSSSPIWNAFQNKRIRKDLSIQGRKSKKPVDFNYKEATKEQIELALKNIEIIKKYAVKSSNNSR